MEAMALRIDFLLARASKLKGGRHGKVGAALGFVCVVPHWPNVRAWQLLSESAYKSAGTIEVKAEDHAYVDGLTPPCFFFRLDASL